MLAADERCQIAGQVFSGVRNVVPGAHSSNGAGLPYELHDLLAYTVSKHASTVNRGWQDRIDRYTARHPPSGSIGRSSIRTQWSNGFRRTVSPPRSITWTPRSAEPTRCRSRISPPAKSH